MSFADSGGFFGGFTPNAVDWNGSSDYLSRASDFTGASDVSTLNLAFRFRVDGGNGTNRYILSGGASDNKILIQLNAANKLRIVVANSTGGLSLELNSSSAFAAGGGWKNALFSCDTNFSAGNKLSHLRVDDVDEKVVVSDASAAFNIDWTPGAWSVARANSGGSYWHGGLGSIWMDDGAIIDFSNSANRRLFYNADGTVVDRGDTGNAPNGSAPLLYLPAPAATVNVNAGTGGNFTLSGSPADTTPYA